MKAGEIPPFFYIINMPCSKLPGMLVPEGMDCRRSSTYVSMWTYVRVIDIFNFMDAISATKLRQNLYHILDSVIDTGIPVEIVRKGRLLRITPEERIPKWDRLEKHEVINGDPDDLVDIDWSGEWRGEDVS
jgi:prevent-host-death family protein